MGSTSAGDAGHATPDEMNKFKTCNYDFTGYMFAKDKKFMCGRLVRMTLMRLCSLTVICFPIGIILSMEKITQ